MSETAVATTNRPVWMDLGTRNMEASKRFYSELFGWTTVEDADPDLGGYTVYQLDGKAVGGVMNLGDNPAPNSWLPYIGVTDVRATVEAVKAAGGEAILEPMDVKTHGSVAVVRDAAGAATGLWQAGDNAGWEVYGQARAVCWTELHTDETDAAKRFYTEVFGWTAKTQPSPGGEYTTFSRDGSEDFAGMAGLMGAPAPHWLIYIAVDDCDATVASARELGATVLAGPEDIPEVGRFAVLRDSEQAAFAVLQPLPRQG
ncbi:MAG TPA: VOC family protein [Candidatus Dormibacteraeota bacterium]|nr:VOC family protein [Candidatus Dormibacteraeota bacterium]